MACMPVPGDQSHVIDRRAGANGELLLRRAGDHLEIISNGVFLMDTRNGESERLLARAALDATGRPARMLIGGLGVGFTLAEAVRHPHARTVVVAEKEPAVVGWHATHLRPYSAGALDDPRVRVICADVLDLLRDPGERYDTVCLDTDNGPDWTVTETNASLYTDEGLKLLAERLSPGGVAAFWSAHASPAFQARLRAHFPETWSFDVPVPRGVPDVVYLARAAAADSGDRS
ncbi:Spermine/spermidine synthase [Thermostaphylospora chromogena]|uniref:Spermine/spermidine synthase n=2 Tax=Thermostaphylospora chromogena TaxID=35622 RepID=A0A1H1A6U3_9ACTN|nr:Spermine/spermidine synthase [Thermostaphylospora chromogena]